MKFKIGKDLEVKKVSDRNKYITIIALFLTLTYTIVYFLGQEDQIRVIYKQWVSEPENDLPINEEAWTKYLVEQGCVLPNICIAQAKVESGFCKSNVARKAHNPFGITYHKCRYVDGKYGVYANYNTWKDAIRCYIHIQDNYLKNINGKYATDPNYVQAIKNVK
jgi:uncharacterized FlgJ-related protein